MGDYNRSTKEIAFGEIPASVMQSINTYIEKHNLGNILTNPVMCIVSTSEKIKKGLFGGGPGPKLLVQTVKLPPHLANYKPYLREYYGTVKQAVRPGMPRLAPVSMSIPSGNSTA